MEIVNRRRDRIYSFVDLYENIKEIMEKDLTFIIEMLVMLLPDVRCIHGVNKLEVMY